jgi:hypothetical protein
MAIEAFKLARISDELTETRQENVWFGGVVAHDVLFTKSIQEGVPRYPLKLPNVEDVPE